MTTTEKVTYCRICEPLCGMVATIEDGTLVSLRADKEDPHSKGFCCTKGVAMTEVVNDPERITRPMKRVGGPGEFEPCSWDEAIGDIVSRLKRLRKIHGPSSIAVHEGNPPYFGFAGVFWGKGFQKAIGTPWFYGINSEDGASRVAATKILYGACASMPIPDVRRTDCLVVIGANPLVSKGSFLHDPRLREHMTDIVERGGRVIVVDPRRTETAKKFEHVGLNAGTDAWFLLSVIEAIIAGGHVDDDFVDRYVSGWPAIRDAALAHPAEDTESITAVPAAAVRDLADAIGSANSAVVYGRTGTCTQRFGTLNNVLQDVINIITGNFQREGGWVWGYGAAYMGELAELTKMASYDHVRTRVRGLPDAYGFLPSSALAEEITTPGDGRIRGLAMIGSNPVVTGPGGQHLGPALDGLEVFFALDIYINETNRYADYVLPATTMYEREDIPIHFWDRYIRPSLRVTEKLVDPPGECREEWEILDDIARGMGLGGCYTSAPLRWAAKIGLRLTPRQMGDLLLRTGRVGDLFGLRRKGWSWRKLQERAPRGVVLHEYLPIGRPEDRIKHKGGRIPLDDPRILDELRRLETVAPVSTDAEYPYRMIGLREMRSHNSWMHNAPKLMPDSRRHSLRVHPDDAQRIGVEDGGPVTITSEAASLTVDVTVTDEMTPGTVALPHGWGHNGGWSRANAAGGVTSNFLASEAETLSGSSVLNGIPVQLTPAMVLADSPAPSLAD